MTNRLRWLYHDYWADLYFGKFYPELYEYLDREIDNVEVALMKLYAKLMAFQAQTKQAQTK